MHRAPTLPTHEIVARIPRYIPNKCASVSPRNENRQNEFPAIWQYHNAGVMKRVGGGTGFRKDRSPPRHPTRDPHSLIGLIPDVSNHQFTHGVTTAGIHQGVGGQNLQKPGGGHRCHGIPIDPGTRRFPVSQKLLFTWRNGGTPCLLAGVDMVNPEGSQPAIARISLKGKFLVGFG